MTDLSIISTQDSSPTIRNELTGDTYHSIHGAIQESNHVFIRHGLDYSVQTFSKSKITILEMGLGTALNALLTYQYSQQFNISIDYWALEAFPLEESLYREINFGLYQNILMQFHACDWGQSASISPHFTFTKIQTKIESVELPKARFNVVYYDAFAPNSQPELWTPEIFEKLSQWMSRPSILTTYCAKGEVKRALKSKGFIVENLPGPPGKREMIRARLG